MFCDYHVHTYYSDDSVYPMEDVVTDAIGLGMAEICFTDHVDYGIKVDPEKLTEEEKIGKILNVDYPAYFEELDRLKEKYAENIAIRAGLEFGMQVHTINDFQKLYDRYALDFVILSCHQVGDKEFWTQDFQNGKTQKEYNDSYYQEILDVISRYKDYSVLGHLDLIKRYDMQGDYPFEAVKEIIAEILKQVIQDGKGIEVNTSSHRYGLKDLTPSRAILRLYKDLGGRIVTIGSDSHEKHHLGAYIEDTKLELKALGYEQYCTFEGMQPIFHEL